MISVCFFCEKITYVPYHVTEINDGDVSVYHMCKHCGDQYFSKSTEKIMPEKKIDLTHLKTPEDLLNFLSGVENQIDDKPPCKCGMTTDEFEEYGRFGCPKCYDHFSEKMEELVYPYHKAREHVGKVPKRHKEMMLEKPTEKIKLLKLQYAKALELEEYEKLPDLKKQIDEVSQSLSSASEDQ